MYRTKLTLLAGTAAVAMTLPGVLPGVLPAAAAGAHRAPPCIEVHGTCFGTLRAALAAAVDGDVIHLPSGTFAGGVTLTKDVTLAGAGQGATIIRGGGPVLTIGSFGDPTPPSVTIRSLTITGGRTTTSPLSPEFFGQDGVWAAGGGIEVPPSSVGDDGFVLGAAVRLEHVTVQGNGVAPTASVDSGLPCPGGHDCPFALAAGGGIDTSGDLTLDHSVVRDNHVGSASRISDLASDSQGGAIRSWVGDLTILHSRIEHNSATGTVPNARFSEDGAIFHGGGRFAMRHSSIVGNTADLASGLPDEVDGVFIDQVANGGAIHFDSDVPSILVDHSTVDENVVSGTNAVGSTNVFCGGLLTQPPTDTRISHSTFRGNRAVTETTGASTGVAHADTSSLQLYGTITHSSVRDGLVTARSSRGDAEAFTGGIWVLRGRGVRDLDVRDNTVKATAAHGSATVLAGGMIVDEDPVGQPGDGGLEMSDSRVRDNRGTATGLTTTARGGGIYDGPIEVLGSLGGHLTLNSVRIEKNRLEPESTAEGAGLFVQGQPLILRNTRIRHNDPDQCVGCGTARTSRHQTQRASDRLARNGRFGVGHSLVVRPASIGHLVTLRW